MARKWWVAAAALMVLIVAAYVGSPYYAVHRLRAAANSGDVDRIEQAVDFPAVRDSLKSQLTLALEKTAKKTLETDDNPFAGIGMLLMPVMVQRTVDTNITPEGIAAFMKRGELDKQNVKEQLPDLRYDYDWRGLDRFAVVLYSDKVPAGKGSALVFERRGWFSWKMIRLQLPANMFNG